MGLCRLLEKGTDGWEYGEQAARAAAATACWNIPFAAEGKHQIPGRGNSSMRPPWKEARCPNPACRASSPARLKSRPTSSGL